MEAKRIRVHYWDVEELMAKMLGKSKEYENDEIEDLESEFYEKFDVDSGVFHNLVEHLMPYTVMSKSDLTETVRIGFVDHEEGVYIVKEDLKN